MAGGAVVGGGPGVGISCGGEGSAQIHVVGHAFPHFGRLERCGRQVLEVAEALLVDIDGIRGVELELAAEMEPERPGAEEEGVRFVEDGGVRSKREIEIAGGPKIGSECERPCGLELRGADERAGDAICNVAESLGKEDRDVGGISSGDAEIDAPS